MVFRPLVFLDEFLRMAIFFVIFSTPYLLVFLAWDGVVDDPPFNLVAPCADALSSPSPFSSSLWVRFFVDRVIVSSFSLRRVCFPPP